LKSQNKLFLFLNKPNKSFLFLKTTHRCSKMVEYICFNCGRVIDSSLIRKKIRCPYCGGRIFYKARKILSNVKAR